MPGGRPPKPIERKRATGNPGKRSLPKATGELVAMPTRSPVPAHLGGEGAAMYSLLLAACEGWLGYADQVILLWLCEGTDRRARLHQMVLEEGEVLYKSSAQIGGMPVAYSHPAVSHITSLEAQMAKWASSLGLGPVERSKLGLVEVKRVSKLDALRNARTQ